MLKNYATSGFINNKTFYKTQFYLLNNKIQINTVQVINNY